MEITKHTHYFPPLVVIAAFGLLVAFALQYPLSTTFPIGGDAAEHLHVAKRLLNFSQEPQRAFTALRNSWYPVSSLLFLPISLLPLDWPMTFVWWMAIGQIVAGAALGLLLYRLGGWPAAASAMALWAILPITVGNYFEDGTMAQLWSMSFLIIFFERLLVQSYRGCAAAFLGTLLAHPITGIVLLITMLVALPSLWLYRRYFSLADNHFFKFISGLIVLATIALAFFITTRQGIFADVFPGLARSSLNEYFSSTITPFVLMVPFGIMTLVQALQKNIISLGVLLAFFASSFLLAFNDKLGIGAWLNRLDMYLVVSIVITASAGWSALVRTVFPATTMRILVSVVFFSALAIPNWYEGARIYAYNESPSRYYRLHTGERAAIEWMRDNLPPKSTVASTTVNRHTEWIPILTALRWVGLPESDPLFQLSDTALYEHALTRNITHAVFFLHREDPPRALMSQPDRFPVIYQSDSAIILKMPANAAAVPL